MKKIFLCFVLLLVGFNSWAAPQKMEMIFLSPQKVAQLMELLDHYADKSKPNRFMEKLAASDADSANCVPMGDGCFHPQFGYMDKKPGATSGEKPVNVPAPKEEQLQVKTFNATETSMINCDKDNYFDIFCGKTKPNAKRADVEIWFDISSSLREVDYNKDPNYCNRRTFMTKIMDDCKENVSVSIYNTSLKEVGDYSSVCMAYGTNDAAKLLQWMKASTAKKLLIVTDIDEVSKEMREFLEERGAKIIGDGVKPFSSTDLVEYAKDFSKTCKK